MSDESLSPSPSGSAGAAADQAPAAEPAVEKAEKVDKSVPDWIPADLRGHKSLTKFKNPAEVAKAYVNLESAFGKRFEDYLKPDAPEDVKAKVRAAMGVPGSPEEYDSPAVPEGVTLDERLVNQFKSQAYKLGIPKAQAKALMDWYVTAEIERVTQFQAEAARQKEEGMKALRERWGGAADRNVALAQRVVAEYGGSELKQALDESGAGNDPAVIAFLARIGQTLAEDNLIDPKTLTTSVEEARKEIARIKAEAAKDRKHPYVDRTHPDHARVVAEVQRLHDIAYGEV